MGSIPLKGRYWKLRQEKKKQNKEATLHLLKDHSIPHEVVNLHAGHVIVDGRAHIWMSTGFWIVRGTGQRGRGIFPLLEKLHLTL